MASSEFYEIICSLIPVLLQIRFARIILLEIFLTLQCFYSGSPKPLAGDQVMRIRNKIALVTGAGSGIGRATALLFAQKGAKIVASDMNHESLADTIKEIKNNGLEAISVIGDVSNNEEAKRMVKAAVHSYGGVDILVNSAGISSRNHLLNQDCPQQVWDRVIEVNLKGTYLVCSHAVPEMKRLGSGSIINLGSIMGLVGYPVGLGGAFNPYPPSKGGVIQFTKNLAIECAKSNIRVNCICPGFVASSMTESLTEDEKIRKELEQIHPAGRLGLPKEIAHVALFLASEESSFVTGASLVVDGGYTAQ